MCKKYSSALLALALISLAGCGDNNTDHKTIRFKLVGDLSFSGEKASATKVFCAESGAFTVVNRDGTFELSCEIDVPDPENIPVTGFSIEYPGLVPIRKSIRPVDGVSYAVSRWRTKPLSTRTFAIPKAQASHLEEINNDALTFHWNSLVTEDNSLATGEAQVSMAAWDTSIPTSPYDVSLEALYPPFPVEVQTNDNSTPYLRTLAAVYLDVDQLLVNPDRGVDFEMINEHAGRPFGEKLESTDNRVFRQDERTGVFVEQKEGILVQSNKLKGEISESGLWIWAKEVSPFGCIDFTVKIGDRLVEGAQFAVYDTDETDSDQSMLYETYGSPGGTARLKVPVGEQVNIQIWIVWDNQIKTVRTSDLAPENCTDKPSAVTMIFPCITTADCTGDSFCRGGVCITPEHAAMFDIHEGDE